MISRRGWTVHFTDGDTLSESSEGGDIEVDSSGLVHRRADSRRLYPWHRIDHFEWVEADSDGRSAIARAADLPPEDDPFRPS
jgi:hypothetical protein